MGNAIRGPFGGSLLMIMGAVVLLACLIAYGIVVAQVDTSYTSAATYTEQQGLTESMGLLPLLFFIVFMMLGLSGIIGGGVKNILAARGGDWMGIFSALIGAVTIVILMVLNDLIQAQLHTAWDTTNSTTNIANFAGVLGIIGVWGMVILWTMVGTALAQFGFAAYGTGKKLGLIKS